MGVAEGPFLPRVRVTGVQRRARVAWMAAAGTNPPGVARGRASKVVATK